ncbi:gluconokinase [Mucilaginibacter pedocola]|uniref:Gluconokinase n=1 Tax=Mucilaginibacter pedocola TaxID=1792845 RepID=A0A1S9PJK2_9SPHI|nr:gluconokinase [Mucilaginibacter pedocola]OOQ60768.1 gluconokinase [Mucilaginibacter pedocola]
MPYANTHKYYIGVDLGTGSTKAVAVDAEGTVVATSQQHLSTQNPRPGFAEQDVNLIWDAFILCVKQIVVKMGTSPVAISFSAAMHSILTVDKKGDALANAILWADARSGEIAENIRASKQGEQIYHNTGTAIYAMSPLCKLIWLRQNQPELFGRAHKFISIKEFIWHKLFGVFEVDHSIASATGMLDILEKEWYAGSLQLAGVTADKLSVPVSTGHMRYLKQPSDLLPGIGTETAFVIGASDGCCANLGGNAVRPGVAALTIGTSGAVRVGSSKPVYNYHAMTFNYLLNEQTFICGGAVNNGGAAADWLLKNFLQLEAAPENYDTLFDRIEAVPAGSEGLLFLPYLFAERAPIWDTKSTGTFAGITFKHQQQHFLRAGLEGICFALYHVLQAVEESAQETVSEIVVSGGFINSPVWVQLLADITGKKLVLLPGGDSSAMGAIYLAMQALGLDVQDILYRETAQSNTVMPNVANHTVYSKVFPIYKKLYEDMNGSMHALHALGL